MKRIERKVDIFSISKTGGMVNRLFLNILNKNSVFAAKHNTSIALFIKFSVRNVDNNMLDHIST